MNMYMGPTCLAGDDNGGSCMQGPLAARGLCWKHYRRLRRYGSTTLPPSKPKRLPVPRPRKPRRTDVGYEAVHARLRNQRGYARAHLCTECGKPARDWAYDGKDSGEMTSPKGRRYSIDLQRYVPMCRRCHWYQDRSAAAIARGWNVKINSSDLREA